MVLNSRMKTVIREKYIMNDKEILEYGKEVFTIEKDAIDYVSGILSEDFVKLVKTIYDLEDNGKVILTGIGKSGFIAKKIAATLSSTGTLSIFLHPAEGIHGDLGILTKRDIVIAISKSGETSEIVSLLPSIKRIGARLASFVGNDQSTLAKESEFVIYAGVKKEACSLNLAPTASTTVALVIGDALSSTLLKLRGFTRENFALFHPGGSLGAKLLLKCEDLMIQGEENPVVDENMSMREVLVIMTSKPTGGASIIGEDGKITGIITDGDIRRALRKELPVLDLVARDVMTKNPKIILQSAKASEALELMENRQSKILVLPVVDFEKKPVGILRIHDLVQAGI